MIRRQEAAGPCWPRRCCCSASRPCSWATTGPGEGRQPGLRDGRRRRPSRSSRPGDQFKSDVRGGPRPASPPRRPRARRWSRPAPAAARLQDASSRSSAGPSTTPRPTRSSGRRLRRPGEPATAPSCTAGPHRRDPAGLQERPGRVVQQPASCRSAPRTRCTPTTRRTRPQGAGWVIEIIGHHYNPPRYGKGSEKLGDASGRSLRAGPFPFLTNKVLPRLWIPSLRQNGIHHATLAWLDEPDFEWETTKAASRHGRAQGPASCPAPTPARPGRQRTACERRLWMGMSERLQRRRTTAWSGTDMDMEAMMEAARNRTLPDGMMGMPVCPRQDQREDH